MGDLWKFLLETNTNMSNVYMFYTNDHEFYINIYVMIDGVFMGIDVKDEHLSR